MIIRLTVDVGGIAAGLCTPHSRQLGLGTQEQAAAGGEAAAGNPEVQEATGQQEKAAAGTQGAAAPEEFEEAGADVKTQDTPTGLGSGAAEEAAAEQEAAKDE